MYIVGVFVLIFVVFYFLFLRFFFVLPENLILKDFGAQCKIHTQYGARVSFEQYENKKFLSEANK